MSDEKTKEEHIVEFITTFAHYEHAMEPYKQGKRDLRNNYRDKDYLTTDDMRQAVRAYRAIQNDIDLEDIQRVKSLIQDSVATEDE